MIPPPNLYSGQTQTLHIHCTARQSPNPIFCSLSYSHEPIRGPHPSMRWIGLTGHPRRNSMYEPRVLQSYGSLRSALRLSCELLEVVTDHRRRHRSVSAFAVRELRRNGQCHGLVYRIYLSALHFCIHPPPVPTHHRSLMKTYPRSRSKRAQGTTLLPRSRTISSFSHPRRSHLISPSSNHQHPSSP
ncbi:hypothetical protein CPB83DRAFT_605243 [Crepidotus variabilis]|uniref:Uncharacterized protein n=1 Tax=Crepidotus variabilis TaxID=179855 RepID=A0A9P6E8M5_9AGAR|nr:hypothetical protein CPB83DRAFT_605243 [Crepidotus variabilis]